MPDIISYLNENMAKVEFKFLNEIGSQDLFFLKSSEKQTNVTLTMLSDPRKRTSFRT